MEVLSPPLPDVYSLREIARAAGVSVRDVRVLIARRQVVALETRFLGEDEAIRAVRLLTDTPGETLRQSSLFQPPSKTPTPALPFAASSALHAAAVLTIILLTVIGLRDDVTAAKTVPDRTRLVFLAIPGPGGGGGGGGLRQPKPAARAELKGRSSLRSPVRTEPKPKKAEPKPEPPKPVESRPVEKPVDKPVVQAAPPVPPVTAPVAPVASEERNQAGVVEAPPSAPPSQGIGTGGGSGTGQGTGMGEGKGSGVGPGEGGGTGGGPYRPGSGITPPGLLREVKPQYTEEARRLGVEGDVVLEIVVKADGTVGPVTLLQRLGSGLDQRAIEAVRQWRFSPAKRFGTPVDVLVEVAVEFKLR
jgi:periplasmic protein TonB